MRFFYGIKMTFLTSKAFKILFVFACIAILAVSLLPGKNLPSDLIWDKAGHFIAYFGLAAICRFGSNKHPSWQLIIAVVFFSLLIEIGQQFIPNRGFEWNDLLANGLGAVSGMFIGQWLKPWFIKK